MIESPDFLLLNVVGNQIPGGKLVKRSEGGVDVRKGGGVWLLNLQPSFN